MTKEKNAVLLAELESLLETHPKLAGSIDGMIAQFLINQDVDQNEYDLLPWVADVGLCKSRNDYELKAKNGTVVRYNIKQLRRKFAFLSKHTTDDIQSAIQTVKKW